MSLSAISSSSLLDSSYLTSLLGSSATSTSSTTSATSTGSTTSSTTDPVTTDLTALLKDLASGNTTGAKSDLTQLKADVKAKEGSMAHHGPPPPPPDGDSSSTSSTSPMDQLLAQLTSSLNSGSTSTALTSLTSFLVGQGQSTGVLLNTTA